MVRLTRAQQQERTRAAVLAAARTEFAKRGYAEAKVDGIAERAELTRGAVYSNFPSKRALYLAVLLDAVDRPAGQPAPEPVTRLADAVGGFARVWLDRLPMPGDTPGAGNLALRSLTGVFDDEPGRTALAHLARLEAVLLGLALESCGPRRRRVRLAELVLTLLYGAGRLAEAAPGFGDPFDVVRACQHLAGLDLADAWEPPHLPFVDPARSVDEPWAPLEDPPDLRTGRPVGLEADGVVTVLGTGRLGAAEETVRAARAGDAVTVVVVTGDPAELGRLVRLRVADLCCCLGRVFGPDARPGPRLVLDDRGAVAHAAGVATTDDTEAAVRVRAGRIVARADGRGAGHAAAGAGR
ncbi:MAG TPA: TetR/AcrR family transcriptional regulator [Actinophytocola sp.]|uniref:TetR/AcrR family transcriptional regulator n=1 Tax=Actinophytocola sp. TaxID=1872138 RepID=UPI002DB8CD8C|nr:TetR/AcrR family transcriptional regulator [Actinophytocola sp.]HEU5469221.1 TetR/AcrR family transcriptional regulator [Actinophytocola sp.]